MHLGAGKHACLCIQRRRDIDRVGLHSLDQVTAATSSSNTELNTIGIVRGSHGTLAATAIQSRDIFIQKVEVVYFWLIVM